MHALVLMAPSGAAPGTPELQADHERFIDGLDKDNKVVAGGGLKPATGQFEGACVVRCASLVEAREIAGSDQLVRASVIRCEVPEWELIGINVSAVDRKSLPHPDFGLRRSLDLDARAVGLDAFRLSFPRCPARPAADRRHPET